VLPDLRVPRPPALKSGSGLGLVLGPRDLDQRDRGAAAPGRPDGLSRSGWGHASRAPLGGLDAWRLALLLGVVRRPGGVGKPGGLLLAGQLEQRLDRPGRAIHPLRRITDGREAAGDGVDGEPLRLAAGHLVPVQGRRDTGIGGRADGVGRGDGPILRVLVVVEEDPVPLLLPPLGGGDLGSPSLHLPREGDRGPAHLGVGPAPLDPAVDVEAPRAGGLRPAREAVVFQHLPCDQGNLADLGPGDGRHRVEVDPELVGVVEVVRPHRVRVEVDAAQIDDPEQLCRVPDHDLLGGAAGGEAQLDGLDPFRPRLGRALLKEGLAAGALDEALERHRPPVDPANRALGDGRVVVDELELGVPGLGKEDLARVGDDDLAAPDLQDLDLVRHANDSNSERATF